ncbi:MAG: hypothetical protein ACRD4R_04860 [Candidatus Acidiferrales bacterium]
MDSAEGISGRIVDSATGAPISGGHVIVALEQQDGTGTDVVFTQADADATGHFSFRMLPTASPFDLVAVAIDGSGVAYNATVVLGVPTGSSLGAIPLVPETAGPTAPAKIGGFVTASSGSRPSFIRATVSAIQTVTLHDGISLQVDVPQTVTINGGDARPITIPSELGTSADILVRSASGCPASAGKDVNCAAYTMVVPGSNPSVALFATGKISYGSPAAGPALYSVRANSFMPSGIGASVCIPSFQSVIGDEAGNPLKVAPAATVRAQTIAFTGCW